MEDLSETTAAGEDSLEQALKSKRDRPRNIDKYFINVYFGKIRNLMKLKKVSSFVKDATRSSFWWENKLASQRFAPLVNLSLNRLTGITGAFEWRLFLRKRQQWPKDHPCYLLN